MADLPFAPGWGDDLALAGRFLAALPGFLRRPVSREEAAAALERRLADRGSDLLALARHGIYEQPGSPYLALLERAGCEYGDLERLVATGGPEGALQRLCAAGVYLTVDELRGRRTAVRGSAEIVVDRRYLRNPFSTAHLAARSGGSRGPASPMLIDLAALRTQAGHHLLTLEARGGAGWRHGSWGVPGSAVMGRLLQYAIIGAGQERWFSQVDPSSPELHPRYRWSARAMVLGGRLVGRPLPGPEYVPPQDPLPIARWMAEHAHRGTVAHLVTFPSSALRVCRAAQEAGLDIEGARFSISGEPITVARLAGIRASGAVAYPLYGSSETGQIGWGCLRPAAPDDLHVATDMHALIPWDERAGEALPAGALLVTSLRRTSRMLLLNVSLGDHAELSRRVCGCPVERLGLTTHLRAIRSHEKLTAGGMTFLRTRVVELLEDELPARFGGGPMDYQLLEEEDPDGRPRLRLLVEPELGPLDAGIVLDAFLAGLGGGSGVERVMELQWRQAGLVVVERRTPLTTASGKLQHLHRGARDLVAAG
jgi:hypothetical protein